MNGLAGCSVSTIGKPHEYLDPTGTKGFDFARDVASYNGYDDVLENITDGNHFKWSDTPEGKFCSDQASRWIACWVSFVIINPPEREAIRLDEGRPKTRSTHLGRFRDRTANGFIRWTRKPQELRSRTLWPPKTALSCLSPFVAMVQPAHSP